MTPFKLYTADFGWTAETNERSDHNLSFPNATVISDQVQLEAAIRLDHMAAKFDRGAAQGAKFESCDVFMFDIDSKNVVLSRQQVEGIFPDFEFWLVQSKGGSGWHIYFPVIEILDEWMCRELVLRFYDAFRFHAGKTLLDQSCKNLNRKFYATQNSVFYHPGKLIDDYLASYQIPISSIKDHYDLKNVSDPYALENVECYGSRHAYLMALGGYLNAKGLTAFQMAAVINTTNSVLPASMGGPLPDASTDKANSIDHVLESLIKYNAERKQPVVDFVFVEVNRKRRQITRDELDRLYKPVSYDQFKVVIKSFVKCIEKRNVSVYDLLNREYISKDALFGLFSDQVYKVLDEKSTWVYRLCIEYWWATEPTYRGIVFKTTIDGPHEEDGLLYFNVSPRSVIETLTKPTLPQSQAVFQRTMRKIKDAVSSGYDNLDGSLPYRGFVKGEVYQIIGASGFGKSLFLQNISYRAMKRGQSVLYVTTEQSADDVHERLVKIHYDRDSTDSGVLLMKETHPIPMQNIDIRWTPSKAFSIGLIEDFMTEDLALVVADYADDFASPRDMAQEWEQQKLIYLELANLAIRNQVPILTASQGNRSMFDHSGAVGQGKNSSNIAGAYAKVERWHGTRLSSLIRMTWSTAV